MARVKIKTHNSKDPARKSKLLEILSSNNIYVTRIITNPDGFVVLTDSETELDKIFNNKTDKMLENNNFQVQIPPQLRENRSVMAFKIDNHIYQNSEEDIIEELSNKNEWVGKIAQIYKFPNSNTLKITFDETSKALKAQETGLLLFSMRIPKYDVQQAQFHSILTCFRCYAMEDHTTNNCHKAKEYKVCSECSQVGHIWRDCREENKKCINCNGPHGAMTMKCPQRKAIIAEKRKEAKEKKKDISYSAAAKRNMTAQPTITQKQGTSTTETRNIVQCMVHAHFLNVACPGSYEEEVNFLFTANGLPTMKVPKNPPSALILAKLQEAEEVETFEEAVEEMEAERENIEEIYTETQGQEILELDENYSEQSRGRRRRRKAKGTDLGLTIYTSEAKGLFTENITTQQLLKGIEDKTFKYTFTDDRIDDTEILVMLEANSIDLTNCFAIEEDGVYNKIRNGLVQERTPPQNQKQRKQNK